MSTPLPHVLVWFKQITRSDFHLSMVVIFSPRMWGTGGYNKDQFVIYNHCLKLYTKVTCQSFLLSTCVHTGRTHITVTHIFFFSFTLIFQAQHYFRHLKYIIWRIFLIWKCITLSTSRECIHVKRFMITVMKPYSFLNDFDSILQECVHFYSSTTDQRQSTLHTTNFRYAVLKPFSKIYFCL